MDSGVNITDILEQAERECLPLMECLCMAGINHKAAPVELREKVSIKKGESRNFLRRVEQELGLDEMVALFTCNRTEFYFNTESGVEPASVFAYLPGMDEEILAALSGCMYVYNGREVVEHIMKVATGLDSLVLGETQISGQVKKAYERSREMGLTGRAMNLLFQKTFETAKRVHTTTSLASHRASVPSVALQFSEAIFEDLHNTSVLVIGTGEISELTVTALKKRGAEDISFVTRTEKRAEEWREKYGPDRVTTLDRLEEALPKADIIVSATRTDEPVITRESIKAAMKKRSGRKLPLLLLDLGMPRNIDPEVGKVRQAYLYNIDDLTEVVEKNKARMKEDLEEAGRIVTDSIGRYLIECRTANASETIKQFRSYARDVADLELARTMKKLPDLSEKEKQEMEVLVHRILGKLLHPPTEGLRTATSEGMGDEAIAWARKLFGLENSGNGDKPED